MTTRHDPVIRDLLAAEYALGTLHGAARARFARMLRSDRELAELVTFWETRLGQLGATVPAQSPSAAVWKAIQKRLGFEDSADHPSIRSGDPAWMRFGRYLVSGMALIALVVGVQISAPPITDGTDGSSGATAFNEELVAEMVIRNEWGGAQWRIRGIPGERKARLEVIKHPPVAEDKDLEMWFIADASSAPVSIWICPDNPGEVVDVTLDAPFGEGVTFAVSLEPKGGSPGPGPTGPVLFASTYTG